MKSVLILYDGMADRPVKALDGRTPLQAARCSTATGLAVSGRGGMVSPMRREVDNRPEVRLAMLLGADKHAARLLARGPLEALGAGSALTPETYVYRGDFVTLDGSTVYAPEVRRLSREETDTLATVVQSCWDPEAVRIEVVAPGRVLVFCAGFAAESVSVGPAATAVGEDVEDILPRGRKSNFAWKFLKRSMEALADHPINHVRVDLGENPANGLWLWGGGPAMPPPVRPVEGALFTQSLMGRGLAHLFGMDAIAMDDVWAEKLAGKKERSSFKIVPLVEALREKDFLMVYVEAPAAVGRYGSAADKVWALETLDHYVLAPLHALLEAYKPCRVALMPDGMVRTGSGRAISESTPLVVSGTGVEPDAVSHWDEVACADGSLGTVKFSEIGDWLLK